MMMPAIPRLPRAGGLLVWQLHGRWTEWFCTQCQIVRFSIARRRLVSFSRLAKNVVTKPGRNVEMELVLQLVQQRSKLLAYSSLFGS